VTRRIRRRGERGISRKTIARGMPGDFRCDRGDYARVLHLNFAREAAGASSTRHSLRPLICWANSSCTTRAPRAAGMRSHILKLECRHCEEQSDEAIHSFFARRDGLLRGACHRARLRATRWLAMTVSRRATLPAVIARLDRAIQYSEASVIESRSCGVLDTPHARGMTTVCEARLVRRSSTSERAPDDRLRERDPGPICGRPPCHKSFLHGLIGSLASICPAC